MQDTFSDSIRTEPKSLTNRYRYILGPVTGLILGGLMGFQTDLFFWHAEMEWGLMGILIGVFCAYTIPYIISQLYQPFLAIISVTVVISILTLSGWIILTQYFLSPLPLLEQGLLLLGCLFFPFLAWKIGAYIISNLATPRTLEAHHASTEAIRELDAPKLVDSSAIIDGRILPLCKTGFLQGRLFVPKCILQELQLLADSPHPDKRIRGKRGLDILSQLRTVPHISIVIPDVAIQANIPVDEQLLRLAETLKGSIITNDWNLAQVAGLQGLTTLNINELTFELRPLILPGQTIRIFIQKEGQGPGQGAAHLDDGTLVIVDHGNSAIGKIVEVQVTRYMQTNTGRMIFASLIDNSLQNNPSPLRSRLDTAQAV